MSTAVGRRASGYGLQHICHHEANSVVVDALLTLLAMCVERLYRLRYRPAPLS